MCDVAPEVRDDFDLEQFKWARMIVASRNFGVNINGVETDALVPYAGAPSACRLITPLTDCL